MGNAVTLLQTAGDTIKDSTQLAEDLLDLDASLSHGWQLCETLLDRRTQTSKSGRWALSTDVQSWTTGTRELGELLSGTFLLSIGKEKSHKKWSDS